MKIISYIFGIFFLAMILCSFSCSPQTDDSGSSINIFKPPKDIRDRNNTRGRGVLKPDIVTMKKSMRNVQEENDSETLFAYLATIIGLIALIVIAVLFERYMRYRMDTTADSPAALFMELCLAHRLTRMERNLIERVAEASDIDNPLPVFLDPQYLAKSSNDNKFITSRQNIEYLLGKLFDNKSESDTTYITKRSSILTPADEQYSSNESTMTYKTTIIQPQQNTSTSSISSISSSSSAANSDISMKTTIIALPDNSKKS